MLKFARIALLLLIALFMLPATAGAQTSCDEPRADPATCTPTTDDPADDGEESEEEYRDRLCADSGSGEQCQAGRGRKTAGGGNTGNVSHNGWPAITGVLWKVTMAKGKHRLVGDALNDELLGHHGNDTAIGNGGKDVLWGDWELAGNNETQSDVLRGGDGNDFLYPSHGKNMMYGDDGNDRIIAYYGHGLIDCGPGKGDYAQTRWQSSAYTVKNCEHIRHFCAFGSKPNGDCKKPGENALAVLSRQASHKALLAFLDAW